MQDAIVKPLEMRPRWPGHPGDSPLLGLLSDLHRVLVAAPALLQHPGRGQLHRRRMVTQHRLSASCDTCDPGWPRLLPGPLRALLQPELCLPLGESRPGKMDSDTLRAQSTREGGAQTVLSWSTPHLAPVTETCPWRPLDTQGLGFCEDLARKGLREPVEMPIVRRHRPWHHRTPHSLGTLTQQEAPTECRGPAWRGARKQPLRKPPLG
ncbi:hypothetical protein P7K49_024748 [Saguinus oedipus]|uniref:Uncharacterized protein n=1 Tax=Saguinus oedipus TaxID=9490 RepID=A0ABQ9UQF7_SAGOE|nr:hypothetical protein P7K49_024748 [Saguinus oedipus]